MRLRAVLISIIALGALWTVGCKSGTASVPAGANYFPLSPNSSWTYQIDSKSQNTQYQITDQVVGMKYVPALKVSGLVVDESYSLSRGGKRPLVYYSKDGYLARLSALDYDQGAITTPAWGRSEEAQFLPLQLAPNLTWNNTIYPYGQLSGAFHIVQTHQTFAEAGEVNVPAGHFAGCIRVETQAHYEGGAYATNKQDLKLKYTDWYAPNVGLIKTVAVEANQKGSPEMERVELVRFSVNPSGN